MERHERYHEWTACETFGHIFVDGRCRDCNEKDDFEPEDLLNMGSPLLEIGVWLCLVIVFIVTMLTGETP